MSGSWQASYSLSVFFMYQNAIDSEGNYFDNRRDFTITVDDACATQPESDLTYTYSDKTYYIGSSPLEINFLSTVAFTNKPWCPWKVEVNLVASIQEVGDITNWNPSGVLLRVTDSSPVGTYTVTMTYKYAYSYGGTFGVTKATSF